jgi:hypothetical protein
LIVGSGDDMCNDLSLVAKAAFNLGEVTSWSYFSATELLKRMIPVPDSTVKAFDGFYHKTMRSNHRHLILRTIQILTASKRTAEELN